MPRTAVIGLLAVLIATGDGFAPQIAAVSAAPDGPVYYIRAGATGRNDGSDWTNAYRGFDRLARGATYYVADGTYPAYTFAKSGTAYITLRKATTSDHGTGTGWQDSYGDGSATFTGTLRFLSSYWTVDGAFGSGKGVYGFDVDMTTGERAGYGIYISGHFVTIKHVSVRWPDRDDERYMTAGGTSVAFEVSTLVTPRPSHITLSHAYLKEVPGGPMRFYDAQDVLVEYVVVQGMHSDAARHGSGISARGNAYGSRNFTIRYNWFEDFEGTGGITLYDQGGHADWFVYGNVFHYATARAPGHGHGAMATNNYAGDKGVSNCQFYNNTIVGGATTGVWMGTLPGNANIGVSNNLWSRTTSLSIAGTGVSQQRNNLNSGDPRFVNVGQPLGPDGRPFTADDGFVPPPGSSVCGAGQAGADIGAYRCGGAGLSAASPPSGDTPRPQNDAPPASGGGTVNTYYVSTTGSDSNPGTLASPWASLSKANATLRPGNTLYIRGGTYTGIKLDWNASGSVNNPITITNYPGETPIFDGGGRDQFLVMGYSSPSYVIFKGLEVRNYSYNAFALAYGHHITIKNNYIHDIQAVNTGSIYTGAFVDSYVHHIIIENNHFKSIGRTANTPNYTDHAVYPSRHSSYITIRNNLFEDQRAGAAIHAYDNAAGTIDHVLIYNNIIHITPGKTIWGIIAGDTNVEIYNNSLIIDPGTMIHTLGAVAHHTGAANELVLKNNIFYGAVPTRGYIDSGYLDVTADYNLYYPGAVDPEDKGSHSKRGNPQFVSSSDFHLQSGSPAINAGIAIPGFADDYDGVSRPQGNGFDIGAYEFRGTGTPTVDRTPPRRSGGVPTGTLPAGTTTATLSLTTDEEATCKYGTTVATNYGVLPDLFPTTGGTAHRSPLSGLVDGRRYTYVVRCQDTTGNANPDDYQVAFSVSMPPPRTPLPPVTPAPPSSSLILHWTFDEGSGTTAQDASGRGYHGVLRYGPRRVAGKVGRRALEFDGVDDAVTLPSLSAPKDKTYALWVYPRACGGWTTLIEFGNDAPWFGIAGPSGTCNVQLYFKNPISSSVLTRNQWSHLVYTSDSASNVSRIYINGVERGRGTANTKTTTGLGVGFHIGDTHFNGLLDDVRIYNRALSAEEVRALYN